MNLIKLGLYLFGSSYEQNYALSTKKDTCILLTPKETSKL